MAHQERTEKATSRRKQKARDQGQFAYSQELTSAMTLAACSAAILYSAGFTAGFRSFFAAMLQRAPAGDNVDLIRHAGVYFLTSAAPVFVAAVAAALAGNFLQGLPIFAHEGATFKWQRLNPFQGLSRLKVQISWLQWAKLIFLVGVVSLVLWKTLANSWDQVVTLPAHSMESSNEVIRSLTVRVVSYIIAAICAVAIGDFFLQRRRFEKSIKQTKAEVKEDMKALEALTLL